MSTAESSPELEIKDGFYYLPYTPPEYPEIPEDYLPENVQLHFEFGPHTHPDHFEAAAAQLESADIWVPEAEGTTPDIRECYQRISKSNHSNFQKLTKAIRPNSYGMARLTALQGTYKTVCFVDTEKGEVPEITVKDLPHTPPPTLEEILAHSYYSEYANVQHSELRDATILRNLGQRVTQAVTTHPKLRTKPTVKVLATFGSLHMPVYTQLAHNPAVSAAEWRQTLTAIKPSIEVFQTISQNKPVSTELLAKTAISAMFGKDEFPNKSNQAEITTRNAYLKVFFENIQNGSAEIVRRVGYDQATADEIALYNEWCYAAQQNIASQITS